MIQEFYPKGQLLNMNPLNSVKVRTYFFTRIQENSWILQMLSPTKISNSSLPCQYFEMTKGLGLWESQRFFVTFQVCWNSKDLKWKRILKCRGKTSCRIMLGFLILKILVKNAYKRSWAELGRRYPTLSKKKKKFIQNRYRQC